MVPKPLKKLPLHPMTPNGVRINPNSVQLKWIPLVLAMGLGFGDAMGATEGFGILSMASIGPILSVMATGLWVQYREKQEAEIDKEDWGSDMSEETTS